MSGGECQNETVRGLYEKYEYTNSYVNSHEILPFLSSLW